MTFILESAARITSGVAHGSSFYAQVGTAGAGALAVLFVIGTGGFGGAALLAAAGAGLTWGSAGGLVGGLFDKLSEASVTEYIITGAPDVFIDEPKLQAASATPDCITDVDGEPVITGSDSIFIHGFPASRITDKLECDGIIKEGSPSVFYGGKLQFDPRKPGQDVEEVKAPSRADPLWLTIFNLTSSVVGVAKAPKNAWEWIGYGANAFGLAETAGVVPEQVSKFIEPTTTGIGLVDTMLLVGEGFSK